MNQLPTRDLIHSHTFAIHSQAAAIVDIEQPDELIQLWRDPRYQNLPKLVVGQGSNLLFCDDFEGVVVRNRIMGIEIKESDVAWHLRVGAGEDWHQLIQQCLAKGIYGLENLALIPGCVGSSPIQNIGAYGVELKDVCESVECLNPMTGESETLTNAQCQFGYRDSIFKHAYQDRVITYVHLKLAKDWQPVLHYGGLASVFADRPVSAQAIFDEVCQTRMAKLPNPKELGNAGSFFKNPVVATAHVDALLAEYPNMPHFAAGENTQKLAAGWLIDQAGLKGFQIGGAAVHDKQALVLVNKGGATAQDVIALAAHVVDTVKAKFGVSLEHEVRFIGCHGETRLEQVRYG
ncbi:UDP-N-acetylenolpyruvoylglucosamine reductase [Vibrio stylophorae]|uniref:UDP-N-acetylenolpyruvoylglucosamine reductase n=1 Tax=Vibrio stylophorae TaxID=659351 RepID=A0ABM8ZQ28_9VIBR|nr:UDP-N-acetylmuramate dehydrogenase [Vibrio stylophorae]CAH0532358.1 UDP-N-acetylenolpyruvoylglucosamine reductase [Vibrio stylophorae]